MTFLNHVESEYRTMYQNKKRTANCTVSMWLRLMTTIAIITHGGRDEDAEDEVVDEVVVAIEDVVPEVEVIAMPTFSSTIVVALDISYTIAHVQVAGCTKPKKTMQLIYQEATITRYVVYLNAMNLGHAPSPVEEK